MKKVLLAAALAACIASPGLAADMAVKGRASVPAPVVVAPSWAGWTASVFGGWGQSSNNTTIVGTERIGIAAVGMGFVPPNQDPHPSGAFFGGEAGYNWQFGAVVAGVAADIRWTGIDGKATQALNLNAFVPGVSLTTTTTASMDWMATAVARVGVLLTDRALLSVKGGVAFADIERVTTITLVTPIPAFNASASGKTSDTQTGWIVGTDLRVALPSNWYAEVGYEFASFGGSDRALNTKIVNTPVGFKASDKDEFHFVRAGLGYRF